MAVRALSLGEQAVLDQVLLGLRNIADLPGEDGDVLVDEEGLTIAKRENGALVPVGPSEWTKPEAWRGRSAGVVIPISDRLPAADIPSDTVLLLPAAAVRSDDARYAEWAAAWSAAASQVIPVPVSPAEASAMAERLAGAYTSSAQRLEVDTIPQPAGEGRVVMLTGLSGSGKSTIAKALVAQLAATRTVTLLDGDVVRTHLSKGLGFSQEDRDTNIRRIGWVAAEVAKHGGVAVCAPIAPYDATRRWVRQQVESAAGPGTFVLVWVSTPIEVCEQRDVKGLYAKARAGALTGFTGIDDPYEAPADAELVIDASRVPVDEAVSLIVTAVRTPDSRPR